MKHVGDYKGEYLILVVRPDGQRPLGRPRHKWKNNIKMNVQEMEWNLQ
jgi:hypothetical protein